MNGLIASDNAGILTLRLARPEKKNAITGAMYQAMIVALERASGAGEIGAVLFAANGDMFTAGNDIADFLAMRGDLADAPPLRFIAALAGFGKPMVAAVQGGAVGIGTTMLLHCDLVYASPRAWFSTPFVDMALVPEAGSSLLLPARIGHARAAAMLLLGERLTAEAAWTAGLVNAVTEDAEGVARAAAAALLKKPRQALAATRRLLRGDPGALQGAMAAENTAFAEALQSAEARALFAEFLQKPR